MMKKTTLRVSAIMMLAITAPVFAQDEEAAPEKGWRDTAELSFVGTAGNTESTTLGFSNKLWRDWERARFELNASAIRAKSRTEDRFAVGTLTSFDVVEPDPELSAESYSLNGVYDHKITEAFYWFTAAGWTRDRFAGIDNRYTAGGGVGNTWIDTERRRFRTNYAITYTNEENVVEVDDFDDRYFGLGLSAEFMQKIGESTTYDHVTLINENLEETDDIRVNMTNSVAVSINSNLALKASLQFLYDNEPAFEELALFDTAGVDTGEVVLVELDELDTIFKTSLVINFD